MTIEDYGLAPRRTNDAIRFLIPSLGPDSGGRASTFKSLSDLYVTKSYYDDLGRDSAAFFSWTFVNKRHHVLVQINGTLPQSDARAYRRILSTFD